MEGGINELAIAASVDDIHAALSRVLAWPEFASTRRGNLLRYLVELSLSGKSDLISEYGVALAVFGKPESFDPRFDSTVRAEMSRLRRSLSIYYAESGAADPWRIEFPLREYAPVMVRRPAVSHSTTAADVTIAPPAGTARSSVFRWIVACAALAVLAAGVWLLWHAYHPHFAVRSVGQAVPRNEYLADGITECLTGSRIPIASLRLVPDPRYTAFSNGVILLPHKYSN